MRQVVGFSRLGQPEVGHPDVAAIVQQQVGRLDIAMEDALAVGILQGLGYLHADAGDALVIPAVGVGQCRELGGAAQDHR
jgi:hypothetical protein